MTKSSKRKDAASSDLEGAVSSPTEKSKSVAKLSDRKAELDQTIQAQVCKLRAEKGVGSPYQIHSETDKKAGSLSDYILTCEAIFGPDAYMIDEDANVEEELKKHKGSKMYTWSGPMGSDCVRPTSVEKNSDRLKFDIPSDIPKDNFNFFHFRCYITSPSLATYKLFEFDCQKMTCMYTDSWGSGSSYWEAKYNEYRKWKLPYKYESPKKRLSLVASVSVGKTYENMIGLEWEVAGDRLDSEQVLAYLNGDEIEVEEYVDEFEEEESDYDSEEVYFGDIVEGLYSDFEESYYDDDSEESDYDDE